VGISVSVDVIACNADCFREGVEAVAAPEPIGSRDEQTGSNHPIPRRSRHRPEAAATQGVRLLRDESDLAGPASISQLVGGVGFGQGERVGDDDLRMEVPVRQT
jgi:hypothetical protein